MAVKRGLQGAVALRKKLKRIDELAERRIGHAIEEAAQAITADAIARAPKDTERLAAEIEYSLSPDKLSATVGPAAKSVRYIKSQGFSIFANRATKREMRETTKDRLFQVFKGYWQEFGTKGAPKRNIPPQPPRPFMEPAWDVNASWAKNNVKNAVNGALKTVAKSKESDA